MSSMRRVWLLSGTTTNTTLVERVASGTVRSNLLRSKNASHSHDVDLRPTNADGLLLVPRVLSGRFIREALHYRRGSRHLRRIVCRGTSRGRGQGSILFFRRVVWTTGDPSMSGHGPFNHRGYVLTIQSHEVRKGGWVATVTIEQVAEGKPQPIRLHGIGFILLRPE